MSNKASISVARSELEAIAGNDRTLFLMDGGFDDLNQRGFPQDIAELIKGRCRIIGVKLDCFMVVY